MSEIYVSAVLGRPVIDPSGVELGRLEDLRLVPGETGNDEVRIILL